MSLCNKLKFYNTYISKTWWCKPLKFKISNRILNRSLKISKNYDIGLQRFMDYSIWVCGKDSIPVKYLVWKNVENLNFLSFFLSFVFIIKMYCKRNCLKVRYSFLFNIDYFKFEFLQKKWFSKLCFLIVLQMKKSQLKMLGLKKDKHGSKSFLLWQSV